MGRGEKPLRKEPVRDKESLRGESLFDEGDEARKNEKSVREESVREESVRQKPLRQKVVLLPILFLGIALSPLSSTGGEPSLSGHWKRPANAGGGHFSPQPEKCGSCHVAQYEAWRGSRHAKAVGPGLLGQLDVGNAPDTALSCYQCHAPLLEQEEILEKAGGKYLPNRRFDATLKKSGVSCAACHVRNGKVVGPPPSGGLKTANTDAGKHAASESRGFFRKSEFCAACHQLDEGYELNGTPLTNTYREWQQSSWGENGVQCQQCHMPDRQHLFRGIHDKEMTLSAIDIFLSGEEGKSKITITNTGAGHYFPTYVTPLIVIKAFLADAEGKAVPGSLKEDFIGRSVSPGLDKQEFDTRIAPGGKHEFRYGPKDRAKGRAVFEIWVYPDRFYNRFFESLLHGNAAVNAASIGVGLRETEKSPYLLWKAEEPLPRR